MALRNKAGPLLEVKSARHRPPDMNQLPLEEATFMKTSPERLSISLPVSRATTIPTPTAPTLARRW